jgi:PhoPQ-activated pathogenicity-related protein
LGKHRYEDAILAQSWHEFLEDPEANPEWLTRLPMVKASYQAMRAA